MSIYMVFSDYDGGDSPSTLHYLGTSLNKVDLNKISDYVHPDGEDDEDDEDDEDNGYIIYVCKFDLEDGGLNMFQSLVGFHAEPDLIEQNNIFKGKYEDFVKFFYEQVPQTKSAVKA